MFPYRCFCILTSIEVRVDLHTSRKYKRIFGVVDAGGYLSFDKVDQESVRGGVACPSELTSKEPDVD